MPPQQLRLRGKVCITKGPSWRSNVNIAGPLSCSYLQHIPGLLQGWNCVICLFITDTITQLLSILTPFVSSFPRRTKGQRALVSFLVPRFPFLEEQNVRILTHQCWERHKIFARQDHFRTKFKSQDYPASWQDMAAPLSQTQNLQTPSVQTEGL